MSDVLVPVELHESVEYLRVNESFLLQCLEGMPEIVDEVSVFSVLFD